MLGTSAKALVRTLRHYRLYSILNIVGLALGLSTFLTLFVVTQYENGFDRWIAGTSDVYVVQESFISPGRGELRASTASFAILPSLRAYFPDIVAASEFAPAETVLTLDGRSHAETIDYVGPEFLKILSLPMKMGGKARPLGGPSDLILSDRLARKYFGKGDAVGKRVTYKLGNKSGTFVVSAVMATLPSNSTQSFDAIALVPEFRRTEPSFAHWGDTSGNVLIKVPERADAERINRALSEFIARRASAAGLGAQRPEDVFRLRLTPFQKQHYANFGSIDDPRAVDSRTIIALLAVGLLALILASINYVNLATAQAMRRGREIAMRKVLGATRVQLIIQFFFETMILVFLAAVVALCLAEIAIPMLSAIGGWDLMIPYGTVMPTLAVVVIGISLAAGFYPAILLSSFDPVTVLSAAKMPSGGRFATRLRAILVGVQFVSAIAFSIVTVVVTEEATYLQRADRGFDRDGLELVSATADPALLSRLTSLETAIGSVPGVRAVGLSLEAPGGGNTTTIRVERGGGTIQQGQVISFQVVDQGFFKTYDLRSVAGRLFDDAHGADDFTTQGESRSTRSVLLDMRATERLGFRSPHEAVGQTLTLGLGTGPETVRVIGVVNDLRFMSGAEPPEPTIYVYRPHGFRFATLSIRLNKEERKREYDQIVLAWNSVVPDVPFSSSSADESLSQYYRPEMNRGRLFTFGAVIAMIVACMGLYGLSAFNTGRRMQEVGIRKVLGASQNQIMLMLLGQTLRPVAISCLIACPAAWWLSEAWLEHFDQRIFLSPLFFVLVVSSALFLSCATVFSQSWVLAHAEPARALRS